MATPIWQWSAVDTAAAIRDGRATSEEVVQAHIDRMHSANSAINAIVVDLSAQAIEAPAPPTGRWRKAPRWASSKVCPSPSR